ncbi:S24 family peptidase [Neptunomonas phycophila]|uniref:S24 family peptidase n=1 Tax=Neptunomonas phycophila TaxID=1572645 RepID=UPI0030F6D185
MLNIIKVTGLSMSPVLSCGDFVIVRRTTRPKLGSIVVAIHPKYGQIIKRVVSLNNKEEFQLSGTNTNSVSTQEMGWFPRQACIGKVVLTIKKST